MYNINPPENPYIFILDSHTLDLTLKNIEKDFLKQNEST